MQDWQNLVPTAEERDFISAVLDTAGTLVVVLDRKGRIVRFNRACERTTGYSFDEVRGRLLQGAVRHPRNWKRRGPLQPGRP